MEQVQARKEKLKIGCKTEGTLFSVPFLLQKLAIHIYLHKEQKRKMLKNKKSDINELCYYKDHIDQLRPEKPIAPISYKQALYEKEAHDIIFISDTIIGIETKFGEYRLYRLEK